MGLVNRKVEFDAATRRRLREVCRALGTSYVEFVQHAVFRALDEAEGNARASRWERMRASMIADPNYWEGSGVDDPDPVTIQTWFDCSYCDTANEDVDVEFYGEGTYSLTCLACGKANDVVVEVPEMEP